MDTLTKDTVDAGAFRTEYRVALAHLYQETNPEVFEEYRFPDGTWLKHYFNK